MSPILFNVVADMLAILIGRAKEEGQIGGLVPHLVEGGVSILQYADDTILFMEHDLATARNMEMVLCLFKQLPDLKLIFIKVNCFVLGKPKTSKMPINNSSDVNWAAYHSTI